MNEPSRREKWFQPDSEVSANNWSLQFHVDAFPLAQKHNRPFYLSFRIFCELKFKVYEYQNMIVSSIKFAHYDLYLSLLSQQYLDHMHAD